MSALDRQVAVARRRLTTNLLFERTTLGVFIAAGLWGAVLTLERMLGLGIPLGPSAWAAVGLGLAVGLLGTLLARVDRLSAAIAIDRAAALKERLSTGLVCRGQPEAFARAALRDAEKVASALRVGVHLPYRAPRLWPWSLASVVAAILAGLFLPQLNLLAGHGRTPEQQQADSERQAVTAVVNQQLDKIKQLAENDARLKELTDELKPLELPDHPSLTPDDVRREAVKRIDHVADRLEKQKEAQQLGALEELKRTLAGLNPKQGQDPASKLSNALSSGDMEQAKKALSELQKQLEEAARSGDPEARQQLAELQKKLEELASQLSQLGDMTRLEKELEHKAGLTQEQAKKLLEELAKMDPKQLEKELQRRLAESGLSQEQIQQLAQKMAQQQQALKSCQGLGKCLSQAAAALQQSDAPGGASAAAAASAALADAAAQLSELEMADQLLSEINAQLRGLSACRSGVCQEGGNRPGPPSDQIGNQGPNYGLGYGSRIGKERGAHQYTPTKVRSKVRGGQIIGQMLIDAPQVRGEAQAEVRDAVNSALRDATDAIEREEVPRQYERVLRGYFDQLAGLSSETKGDRSD